MGHFGFSYVGAIYLAMLTIPNLIWTKHQPAGYNPGDSFGGSDIACSRIPAAGALWQSDLANSCCRYSRGGTYRHPCAA